MADDLSYGEGGLTFPRVDDLLQASQKRPPFEHTWAAKCAATSKWVLNPPSSPQLQPYHGQMTQATWGMAEQQPALHDGWIPEPPPNNQTPRLAKAAIPDGYPPGNATLTYTNENGEINSIPGLNLSLIEDRSPLLAAAFEGSQSGQYLYLETLSQLTAMPLLRYLYSGSYAEFEFWEDVPTSLLLHCKMYRLGVIYDIEDLKLQAYVNILRQCEFGCSSPYQPIDLCAAIRFAYDELTNHEDAVSAINHYCVSCFLSHNLGVDAQFKQLAFDLRPFHQDLVKVCRDRGYSDESATAIIQMPYKPYKPETYASTETPAIARFEDLISRFHDSDDDEVSPSKRTRFTTIQEQIPLKKGKSKVVDSPRPKSALTLSLQQAAKEQQIPESTGVVLEEKPLTLCIRSRPVVKTKAASKLFVEETSASEDDDMLIVRKRKLPQSPVDQDRAVVSGSDSDFELVPGPEAVHSATSDVDEDLDAVMLVKAPASARPDDVTAKSALCRVVTPPVLIGENADDVFSEAEWESII